MLYRIKLALLRNPRINYAWRYWTAWRGKKVGCYNDLPDHIRIFAKGRSFVDVGCMWGVNGRYSFLAEESGATDVKAVDVFGPTPEFEKEHQNRSSVVEFMLGDITDPSVLKQIGKTDVVFCAGVLYHHPSPFDLLVALRRICSQILILRTFAIPEIPGIPQGAVFYPHMKKNERRLWNLSSLGLGYQPGISVPFDPLVGYGNYFWGITPSCLKAMLRLAGFEVTEQGEEAFAQTMICRPANQEFVHILPEPDVARSAGAEVSLSGLARPS